MTFDDELRRVTKEACRRLRELFDSEITPMAIFEATKCRRCSLQARCRPDIAGRSAKRYLQQAFYGTMPDEVQ